MPRSRDSQAAWSHVSPVLADVSGCAPLPQEVGLCIHMMYTRVCVYIHMYVCTSAGGKVGTQLAAFSASTCLVVGRWVSDSGDPKMAKAEVEAAAGVQPVALRSSRHWVIMH